MTYEQAEAAFQAALLAEEAARAQRKTTIAGKIAADLHFVEATEFKKTADDADDAAKKTQKDSIADLKKAEDDLLTAIDVVPGAAISLEFKLGDPQPQQPTTT